MGGYIFSVILIIYFFILWPNFEELPPRSRRTKRQRLAGRYGLHDKPSVGELQLADSHKEELLNYITFTDGPTYTRIANSKYFYLVESRKSVLSLYCSEIKPSTIDYEALQNSNFIRIQIEEHLLIRFLNELKPLKEVK